MEHLKQNEAEFKLCNIDIWQNDNLGEGVTVVVLDSGDEVFDNMKQYNIEIPFKDENDDTAHGTSVIAVGMQIAPKTKVVYMPYLRNDKEEQIIDWIIEHKDEIDLINCSFSGGVRELKRLEGLGIPIICSSGNDGNTDKDGVNAPGKFDWTIAVGAYSVNNGSVDHYSNGGENLDCVAPSWIYYPNSKGKPVFFNGTSCSAPFVTFSLALYFSWRKRNNLPKMNVEEVRQFIKNNTLDLYEEGHDYESGYGLFRLPKGMPDIKEVIEIDRQGFINSILEGAKNGYKQYKILPSLTIAQAILESAWGTKHIENNLFGMKAGADWKGKVAIRITKEWNGSKYIDVEARFRAYDSFNESVENHNELLGELPRYAKVREMTNYKDACYEVWKAGYATDPEYPEKLINIIEVNNLMKYDEEVMQEQEHWAKKHYDSLNAKGIVIHEQRFDDPITRGEMFALLDRLTDLLNLKEEY